MRYIEINNYSRDAEKIPQGRIDLVAESVRWGLRVGGSKESQGLVTGISRALIVSSDFLQIDIPLVTVGEKDYLTTNRGDRRPYIAASDTFSDGSGLIFFAPRSIDQFLGYNQRYNRYYKNPQEVAMHEMYHLWQMRIFPDVVEKDAIKGDEKPDKWNKTWTEIGARRFAREFGICTRYYSEEFKKRIGPLLASGLRVPRAIEEDPIVEDEGNKVA